MKNEMKKTRLTLKVSTMAMLSLFAVACSTDDSVSEEAVESNQPLPVAFDTYLGRSTAASTTRAAVMDATTLGESGIGVYAMYTKDEQYMKKADNQNFYDESTGGLTTTSSVEAITKEFDANFMNNIKVWNKNNDGAWTYDETRYWPTTPTEFISYLAYGSYDEDAKLYTKTETTTTSEGSTEETTTTEFNEGGDNAIYYKYDLSDESRDLVWNWNCTWNMQFYVPTQWSMYSITNWYGSPNSHSNETMNGEWNPNDNEHNYVTITNQYANNYYQVLLKMAHACARIACVVTSPALLTSDNYRDIPENNGDTVWSGALIKVNKIVLLNDLTSGADDEHDGWFYKYGYLNLANNTQNSADNYETKWEGLSDERVSFTFNGTDLYGGTYDANSAGKLLWQPDGNAPATLIHGTKDSFGNITVTSVGSGPNGYLYVIPQDATTDVPVVYIDYTVYYRDGTTGKVSEGINYTSYGFLSSCNFEAGKAYVLKINIGTSDGGGNVEPPKSQFNAIHFGVEVEEWPTESSVEFQYRNGTSNSL